MTRRDVFRLAGGLWAIPRPEFHLIAHRGGVVDATRAENSEGAILAAIEQGYWMIEVDIRRTRDGSLVLHHDANLQKRFGDSRRLEELSLAEALALKGRGDDRIVTLARLCEMVRGRIRLMLDVKSDNWPAEVYTELRETLGAASLLDTCWVLGGGATKRAFEGRAGLSIGRKDLHELLASGENADGRFLFELASEMNQQSLDMARRAGIPAVAAVNTFRYTMAKRDEEAGPAEDVARLRGLGVTHYQIDSRYAKLFS